ncbi:MAG: hypothetical protein IH889_06090 [Planctomycetes bacterium]|nr:hypothetical protein [Planctomycetota bacterium]
MVVRMIRNKLRLIRYYSADRPRSVWGRATNIAFAAALALTAPAVWLVDRAYVLRVSQLHISGRLNESADGTVWGGVVPDVGLRSPVGDDSVMSGMFQLAIGTEHHGWPFESSRRHPRAQLGLDLFARGEPQADVDLPAGSPLRAAIELALLEAGHDEAVALWQGELPAVSHRLSAWLANGVVWYLLLSYTAWLGISFSRFTSRVVQVGRHARQQQRHREGRCVACGYDLRASEFSERCPECGTLAE